jgi:hypothetical protein
MPVRRFASAADMPPATLCPPRDPANIALACALSTLAFRLHPRRFPPGVYKYSSVEAASDARAAWERSSTAVPPDPAER